MSKELIGISIGSQTSIIGALRGKVADIVLSDSSNRRIPTVVSYSDRERWYGDQAQSSAKSNFKRTVIYPSRWIGVQKDWQNIIEEESKYAIAPPIVDKNNKVAFEINYKGNKETYSPEALMGLYFQKLKKNWIREKIDAKEVVVAVPDFYTAHERKAMLEALRLGNLECGGLVNESSAIALTYGLLRLRDFDQEKPRIVSFVDMGQSKTTIFFGSFTQKIMKIVSVTSERFCGAREFDYLIAKEVAKDFQNKFDLNPLKPPKVRMRLLEAIAKMRKTLTVNKEAAVSIDSLMDGEDCVYSMNKETFEKVIDPVLQKFKKVCIDSIARAAAEAKIKLSDIHSVEMVGDAVRTPIIQQIIKEQFGKEISKTLAPDECIARGCTLYAAMNSPYYTIMNFSFEHYNPYTIVLEYPFMTKTGEITTRTHKIISRGENIPGKKSIKFTEKQTPRMNKLEMKFSYDTKEIEWIPNPLLKSYYIHMPKDMGKEFTFALQFYLDINCLPELTKASIDEVYFEEVPVKVPEKKKEEPKKEEKKEDTKMEEKKEEAKQESPKETPKEAPKQEETNKGEVPKEAPKQESPQEAPKKEEEKKEEPPKMEKVKREKSTLCTLEITDTPYGTTKGLFEQYLQRENEQENDDKSYLLVSSKKNGIEQYIYNTREKMNNVLIPHMTQAEKDKLNQIMDPILDWLYSDDENVYVKKVLEEKSKPMYDLGDKIYSRYNNWCKLQENNELLQKALNRSDGIVKEELTKISEKKTILIPGDVELMKKAIENATKKLKEFIDKANKGNKLEEPPVKPIEVSQCMEQLNKDFAKVYTDADTRKKEEEAKKKKEEEEKKKKAEEEAKKKKEEEEKKKKEEEEKNKKATKEGEDVEMKDETGNKPQEEKKEEAKKEEKKETPKDPNAMDVE